MRVPVAGMQYWDAMESVAKRQRPPALAEGLRWGEPESPGGADLFSLEVRGVQAWRL